MKTSHTLLIGVLLIIVVGSVWYVEKQEPVVEPTLATPATSVTDADVEAYVRTHISTLSPEPEVHGGTFYITDMVLTGGTGIVSYEDGHNAYTADFTYATTGSEVTITSFTVRNN